MGQNIVLELDVNDNNFDFSSNVEEALSSVKMELTELEETINSIHILKPECDKIDYLLAVSTGTLCGIIDVFLVGKPGESPLSDITDKWFENRTKDFAKLCGWDGGKTNSSKSAIRFLEGKFKIPYDQTGTSGFLQGYGVTPSNHHFKSLAHNPTLLGLFFSILDQFSNTSDFVTDGELISLQNADDSFELRGNNIPSKLFCAFVNWIGHLMSDMSGSSGSSGRGMGIPSPLWTWSNDIIAIKKKLNISVSDFDKNINEFATEMFKQGYDTRFQATQAIPVMLNELVVRFLYSVRRIVKYFSVTDEDNRGFIEMWKYAEPFSNPTVKRMLTVAHGTFCLIDVGDATVRGIATGAGTFNVFEFFMRLNVVGVGRFTISLYGETKRGLENKKSEKILYSAKREKIILLYYIDGLKILSEKYDDDLLIRLIDDFESSDVYRQVNASIELADKRGVPNNKVIRNKHDRDSFFRP